MRISGQLLTSEEVMRELFGEGESEREGVRSVDEIIAEIEADEEECEEILDEVCERSSTPLLRIVRMRSSSSGRVQREKRKSVTLLDFVDLDEFGSEIEE